MSIKRWNAKRDDNENQITAALRAVGCHILRLDSFDLLVLRGSNLYALEVKTKTGKLKPSQQKLIDMGWPLHICRTPEDALRAVGL
jgi:hypothetical protein